MSERIKTGVSVTPRSGDSLVIGGEDNALAVKAAAVEAPAQTAARPAARKPAAATETTAA